MGHIKVPRRGWNSVIARRARLTHLIHPCSTIEKRASRDEASVRVKAGLNVKPLRVRVRVKVRVRVRVREAG